MTDRKVSTCESQEKKKTTKFSYLSTLQCFCVEKNLSPYQIWQGIFSAFFSVFECYCDVVSLMTIH